MTFLPLRCFYSQLQMGAGADIPVLLRERVGEGGEEEGEARVPAGKVGRTPGHVLGPLALQRRFADGAAQPVGVAQALSHLAGDLARFGCQAWGRSADR